MIDGKITHVPVTWSHRFEEYKQKAKSTSTSHFSAVETKNMRTEKNPISNRLRLSTVDLVGNPFHSNRPMESPPPPPPAEVDPHLASIYEWFSPFAPRFGAAKQKKKSRFAAAESTSERHLAASSAKAAAPVSHRPPTGRRGTCPLLRLP